jgi:hypothetical protein
VVRHVALSYCNILEAPLPLTGQAWPLPSGINPKKRPQRARAEAVGRLMCQGSPTRCHNPGSRGLFRAHPGVIIRLGSAGVCFLPTDPTCPVCSAGGVFRWPVPRASRREGLAIVANQALSEVPNQSLFLTGRDYPGRPLRVFIRGLHRVRDPDDER